MRKSGIFSAIMLVIFFFALFGCKAYEAKEENEIPDNHTLTIFSWWTAGGEAEGLNELIKLYTRDNPHGKIINAAVAGGAGTNAKAVLKTRMLGGDPPETFQVHGGAELIQTWVKPGLMSPLTGLYEDNGWKEFFPKELIEMISYKGDIYAVPANIHRGNVLWYNKGLLAKNGYKPPTTFDEWIALCKGLKEKGITPIALGSRNKWPVIHLFETLLLSTGGDEFYKGLFEGKISWEDEKVKTALNRLAIILEFTNKNHSALTWDQAAEEVNQGQAAMTVMGDWANGYFKAQKLTPNKEYGAIPVPGTLGSFIVITDTFGMPNREHTNIYTFGFFITVASKEGQTAFNLAKGSIPARTDISPELFDEISRQNISDFKTNKLVPSFAHGSAAVEQFVTAVGDLLSIFISEKEVDKTVKGFAKAAKDAGLGL